MTAADVQAVADSVIALSAAGAVVAWLRRTPRKIWAWRKRKRRDEILECVVPICLIVLTVALAAINRANGDDR